MSTDFLELREIVARRAVAPAGFRRVLHAYEPPGGALPRFHLDRYAGWWLVLLHHRRDEPDGIEPLVRALGDGAAGVVVKCRGDGRGLVPGRVARGDAVAARAVLVDGAGGLRFSADLTDDVDAGAYPDAEGLRAHLAATAAGTRVLNLFAFTCLFAVAALRGGARSAVNVDASRSHLDRGRANLLLNGLRVDDRDLVAGDAHRFCRDAARRGTRFDAIVADPPPFYRRNQVRRGSEESLDALLADVLAVAEPAATVHLLQCTTRVSRVELAERVARVLEGAGRPYALAVHAASVPDLSPRELAPTFKEARIVLGG